MRRFAPGTIAALGLGLLIAGVVVFAVANSSGAPPDFGWTSYGTLEPGTAYGSSLTLSFGDRWTVLWTGVHLLGALLVVFGLLVLTAVG